MVQQPRASADRAVGVLTAVVTRCHRRVPTTRSRRSPAALSCRRRQSCRLPGAGAGVRTHGHLGLRARAPKGSRDMHHLDQELPGVRTGGGRLGAVLDDVTGCSRSPGSVPLDATSASRAPRALSPVGRRCPEVQHSACPAGTVDHRSARRCAAHRAAQANCVSSGAARSAAATPSSARKAIDRQQSGSRAGFAEGVLRARGFSVCRGPGDVGRRRRWGRQAVDRANRSVPGTTRRQPGAFRHRVSGHGPARPGGSWPAGQRPPRRHLGTAPDARRCERVAPSRTLASSCQVTCQVHGAASHPTCSPTSSTMP